MQLSQANLLSSRPVICCRCCLRAFNEHAHSNHDESIAKANNAITTVVACINASDDYNHYDNYN